MKMVSSSHLRCLLLLLLSFSCSSASQRDSGKFRQLHRTPLLSSKQQDLSRSSLLELLLSDLLQEENEALQEESLPLAAGEPEDIHLDLERAVGPLLAPRERKAGCKNFFWKTFTSC